MRCWETFLKIDGWRSEYTSVDRVLRHYARKVKSDKTRENLGSMLKGLCLFAGQSPEELVRHESQEVSEIVQRYVDSLAQKEFSIRYVNVYMAYLKTFFEVNGFKGDRALELDRHYQPSRYRKKSEYIPTPNEIYNMAYAAGTKRNRALILALYTSGLRNSTLRALLFGDVKQEMDNGMELVKLPVYAEMKKADAGACKSNIPYYSFISKEATEALRQYLDERKELTGEITDDEPLFACESTNVNPEVRRHTFVMKKSLEEIVKIAAKKAGLNRWKDVYPHCLRKAFESALRNAGLDLKDQEFLMGHILPGAQDTYYDKTKIETLRSRYAKVNFFPERGLSEDARKRQMLDAARVYGYSDDKIKKIEDALAKYKNVDEALDEIRKLSEQPSQRHTFDSNQRSQMGTSSLRGKEIKIVKGENNLIQLLKEKWELLREISDDRFLLTRLYE